MGWNLIQYITKEYRYQFNGNTVHTISATGISMVLTSHIAANKFARPELGGSSKKIKKKNYTGGAKVKNFDFSAIVHNQRKYCVHTGLNNLIFSFLFSFLRSLLLYVSQSSSAISFFLFSLLLKKFSFYSQIFLYYVRVSSFAVWVWVWWVIGFVDHAIRGCV